MHSLGSNKTAGEKAIRQLHKNAARNIEHGGKTPQITNYTATYLPSRKLSKLDEPDMQDTTRELIIDVLLWTPTYGQAKVGQLEYTYSSSVRIRDVALKTC